MSFLFMVVTSCSRIPKPKPSLNRQMGCRQGDSYFALLLLQFLAYFILAVLSLTKKQVLSPMLLESCPFNHPPNLYGQNPTSWLLCGGCVLSNCRRCRQLLTHCRHRHRSLLLTACPGRCSRCFRRSPFLPQAPGSVSSHSSGWKVTPPG